MKPKLSPMGGLAVALLALVALLGTADTARAETTFEPTLKVAIADPTPEATSDFTVDFGIPEGDVNFGAVISFIPQFWGVIPGKDIPTGAVVGTLSSQATLGLLNAPCNTGLPVEFTMLNSSVDLADTVSYFDDDGDGTADFAADKDGNGLFDAVDKYPDWLVRILPDLQPIRRSAGLTGVAGLPIILQFLIFEPGTVINEALPSEATLGYPSVTALINVGDPDAKPAPGAITDFCSPLTSTNLSLGVSEDNPDTDADEAGATLFINPKDATYTFTTIALGQRDADADSYENGLDTCALKPNEGDPRKLNDGDDDGDGLDAACDPDDKLSNQDEDLDGYSNRGDNCPLDENGEDTTNQQDTDIDQIGDACDPDPNEADPQGELSSSQPEQQVVIGDGTGEPGYASSFEPGGTGGGDGGGGSSTLIIIIVVVVVAVVVIGGAAFALMRRRSA